MGPISKSHYLKKNLCILYCLNASFHFKEKGSKQIVKFTTLEAVSED